jgi:DNA-binding SARP family transcriptional activator
MQFRILGPLEIASGGVPVPLPSLREQRLAAVLLLSANRVVPLASLVDGVWDDDPPASAKRQVQNCLSALRRRLKATDVIVARGPGYQACVSPDRLDAARFHDLVDRARQEPPARAAELLREGLALWRGSALMGLTGRLIEARAAHLDEQRLAAYERRFDLRLDLGQH